MTCSDGLQGYKLRYSSEWPSFKTRGNWERSHLVNVGGALVRGGGAVLQSCGSVRLRDKRGKMKLGVLRFPAFGSAFVGDPAGLRRLRLDNLVEQSQQAGLIQ